MATTANYRTVGKYVRDVDGDMFKQIAGYIGSRSLTKIGQYVETCDAEMYDHIISMNTEEGKCH